MRGSQEIDEPFLYLDILEIIGRMYLEMRHPF